MPVHLVCPVTLSSIASRVVDHLLVLHGVTAYLMVAFLCFGEAAIMLGFVLPGETAVIVGGILASHQRLSLPVVVGVVVVAAVVGDSVGYEVGRHLGPRLLHLRPLRKRRASITRGQQFLCRHGGVGVFVGRFTALLRALVPGLAGMSEMPYRRFLVANAAGAVAWGTTYTLLGYFVGKSIESFSGPASLGVLGGVVALALAVKIHSTLRERRENRVGSADRPEADGSGEHAGGRHSSVVHDRAAVSLGSGPRQDG